LSGFIQFRDRTPYTDNPKTETEVAEDDLHIHSNSKDQVLSQQWELVEVHAERIDELAQEIQPEILGFAEASINHSQNHSSFGRTDVGPDQGNTEEIIINYLNIFRELHDDTMRLSGTTKSASCKMGSSSNCQNTRKAALTPSSSEKSGHIVNLHAHMHKTFNYSGIYLPVNFCTEEDSAREYESSESADLPTPPEADFAIIFRSCLSGAQMDKVNRLMKEVQPKTIVFVATMRKCDVQLPSPLLVCIYSFILHGQLTDFSMNSLLRSLLYIPVFHILWEKTIIFKFSGNF
jgi:hypothetical protein